MQAQHQNSRQGEYSQANSLSAFSLGGGLASTDIGEASSMAEAIAGPNNRKGILIPFVALQGPWTLGCDAVLSMMIRIDI
eukprot:1146199-Pelagomonas_calceolata.AAC.5